MDNDNIIYKRYNIFPEYKKQQNACFAIAFNTESTIMVAGRGCKITVFQFKSGQLKQKQLLSHYDNNYNIVALYFMVNSNQFISGTYQQIAIWSYSNKTQQYYCLQLIKQAHLDWVNRVIMNKEEDLIISCSNDETIKFWKKKNEWECLQTLVNHKNCVFDIFLNESCTQLVSCDKDGSIIISQQCSNYKWRKIQRIQSNYGYRICFIHDNLIAFQSAQGRTMEIYQLNQQNKQFIFYKGVLAPNNGECLCWFPMQFNFKLQLLMNKNGQRIVFYKRENNNFIIEQSINRGTIGIWGAMTNDFQYLVIWDRRSKEFQVLSNNEYEKNI